MINISNRKGFGALFKKYRLRSEIETLSHFGDLLAEEGVVYESSLFTRWQNGSRLPNDRRALLSIISVFLKQGGLNHVHEANLLLEKAGYGYLTNKDKEHLPLFNIEKPFQVPRDIGHFTGRRKYISYAKKALSQGRALLLYGQPGVGKTALAISVAHQMQEDFPDGILWYQLNSSSIMDILAAIAAAFGQNITNIQDVSIRASLVRSIIAKKRTLLIFDNLEHKEDIEYILPGGSSCSALFTSIHPLTISDQIDERIHVDMFSLEDTRSLFRLICGKTYAQKHMKEIKILHELTLGLPIALNVAAKYILHHNKSISDFINSLQKGDADLDSFTYHNKSVRAVLQTAIKRLTRAERIVLTSTGIFAGKDFSLEAIAYINGLSKKVTQKHIDALINFSLVEKSTNSRYRIHPLVKIFLTPKIKNSLYVKTAEFYLKELKKQKVLEKYYGEITAEFININTIIDKCLFLKEYHLIISIWKYLSKYMWDTRHWSEFETFGLQIYNLCDKLNNTKTKIILCIDKLSQLYSWQLNVPLAEQYIKEGLELAIRIEDDYLIHCAEQRLGRILIGMKKLRTSQQLLSTANTYFQQNRIHAKCADTLKNLGEIALRTGHFHKASYYFSQALLKYNFSSINTSHLIEKAIVLIYQGEIFFLQQNLPKGKKYFRKGISLCVKSNEEWGIRTFGYIGLGLIHEQEGNMPLVQTYYMKAKQWTDLPGFKDYLINQNSFFFAIKHIIKKSTVFNKLLK